MIEPTDSELRASAKLKADELFNEYFSMLWEQVENTTSISRQCSIKTAEKCKEVNKNIYYTAFIGSDFSVTIGCKFWDYVIIELKNR